MSDANKERAPARTTNGKKVLMLAPSNHRPATRRMTGATTSDERVVNNFLNGFSKYP